MASHSRSRKGAWIEICGTAQKLLAATVAPARERGLKFDSETEITDEIRSLPQGSVD